MCLGSVGCWVRAWVWGGLVWRVFRSARVPRVRVHARVCGRVCVRRRTEGTGGGQPSTDRQEHSTPRPLLCAPSRVCSSEVAFRPSPTRVSRLACACTRESLLVLYATERNFSVFFSRACAWGAGGAGAAPTLVVRADKRAGTY